MKYRRKVKDEQVITLQMDQQLKIKNINVAPGQLFCRQCKAKFLLETDSLNWCDNEFTECQTPRKKLQSIGISPVSLHSFMKTLKSDISVAHKTQVDCLKDADVWFSWYKMIRKRKWMTWLGFKSYCKKNWKQHHIQNKFLPWYLINGLECTVQNILISLNTLFELHMKSKK